MANELYINDNQINGYLPYSQNCYACSSWSLYQFLSQCTDNNLFSNISKGFTQPLDFVNFIRVYPYNVIDYTYTLDTTSIMIGNTGVGIDLKSAKYPSILGTCKKKIHITKYFDNIFKVNNFTNCYPYTQVDCYLPYVGFITLDINELTPTSQIIVDLVIDVVSGSGIYSLSRYDKLTNQNYVFYTTQTNFATDIAIGGTNGALQSQKLYNTLSQVGMGLASTAMGAGTMNKFLISNGVGQLASAMMSIPSTLNNTVVTRGSNGNYLSSFNNPHAICFIVKSKKVNDYDSFKSVYGKPLNKEKDLSTLKGMTFIPNPKLEIYSDITTSEYDELRDLMQNGIILDSKEESKYFKVSNVTLNGTFTEYGINFNIKNVKIAGTYHSQETLFNVSDVKLNGNYEEEKSTFTLTTNLYKSGVLYSTTTTEYSSGASVNPTTIARSNIPYGYEINRYSPTSTFYMTSDKELNIYYSLIPEPTYYDLSIVMYVENSYYKTVHRTYEEGTWVTPYDVAYEERPSLDWTIKSTEPTNDISMYSDRSINVYYEKPTTLSISGSGVTDGKKTQYRVYITSNHSSGTWNGYAYSQDGHIQETISGSGTGNFVFTCDDGLVGAEMIITITYTYNESSITDKVSFSLEPME